jgi:hypothetical protein
MQRGSFTLHSEVNSNAYRPQVDIDLPSGMNFVAIHIFHFGETRLNSVWSTFIPAENIGKIFESKIENLIDGEVYGVYIGFSENYVINLFHRPNSLPFVTYFTIKECAVDYLPESRIQEIFSNQLTAQETPWIVEDIDSPLNSNFKVVIFFTGVDIHIPSEMKGIRFFPITSGLSNKSIFDAIRNFLSLEFSAQVPEEIGPDEGLKFQPLYAVELCNILARSEAEALKFSDKLGYDISTILTVERGDRPSPLLTFIRNETNGTWRTIPKDYDFRGNLLPPMQEVSIIVERLLHIVRNQSRSRLVLELYVQSIAERDRSFKFFRQWSLLETIADNNIITSDLPVLNLDGTEIKLSSGKALTTARKEGKVYAYLRNSTLSPIRQGMSNGKVSQIEGAKKSSWPADEDFTLWEAISASYKIRNEVAHEGAFKVKSETQDRLQILANRFFSGEFDFLHHAVDRAVWAEFHRLPIT